MNNEQSTMMIAVSRPSQLLQNYVRLMYAVCNRDKLSGNKSAHRQKRTLGPRDNIQRDNSTTLGGRLSAKSWLEKLDLPFRYLSEAASMSRDTSTRFLCRRHSSHRIVGQPRWTKLQQFWRRCSYVIAELCHKSLLNFWPLGTCL